MQQYTILQQCKQSIINELLNLLKYQYSIQQVNQTIITQMNHQSNGQHKLQQICTHINKLTKKNVQALLNYNYIPACNTCKTILHSTNFNSLGQQINIHLCLHCGYTFCNNHNCILNHEKDTHIFWTSLQIKQNPPPSLLEKQPKTEQTSQKCQINCKICGSIDKLIKQQQSLSSKQQAFNKLLRFTQYIQNNIIKSLCQRIITQFHQYQELGSNQQCNVFGFKNLGNTCFLNSVLQILYYTQPFLQIYNNFGNKPLDLIAKQKSKRKQIQYFYDDILQKQLANTWHVVSDKKAKNKQKLAKRFNLQHFLLQGFIKDTKLNLIISNFIQNINQFLQLKQLHMEKIVLQPIDILIKLGQLDGKYSLKHQQDAEELLVFLIDVLSQGQALSLLGKQQQKKQRYRKIQYMIGRQKIMPIQQIFGSYLASHVVCLSCNQQSWVIDFTYHYPIPLQNNKIEQISMEINKSIPIEGIKYYKQLLYPEQSSLYSCKFLQGLFKPERLTNKQNYYRCEKCQGLSAIKQFYIVDAPEILVLSFKRFEHNKKYKIKNHVKFQQFIDLKNIVLRQKLEQDELPTSTKYQLYGVIVHKGQTITSGHYINFAKIKSNKQNNKYYWYEFSDDKIKKVTSKQVFRQQAYILFYQQIKSQ